MPNLARSYLELQKKIGQKGIFKPAENASAEEIKSFREALGIPTSPEKYEIDFGKDAKVDQSIVDWAKKVGAENGVEPAALKAIIGDYLKFDMTTKAAQEAAKKTEMQKGFEGLRKEWGDAFDGNIQRVNFAAEKTGGKELIDHLVKLGVQDDSVLLKHFEAVSKLLGEDRLREGGVGDGRAAPHELDAEIASVQQQMFSMKPTDGRYTSLKQRYESLWKQKTGGR